MKRIILSAVFSWLAATTLASGAPALRILPLGDSMTSGFSMPTSTGGYRTNLYSGLGISGYTIDFVGTQVDTPVSGLPDLDHEGHGGYKIGDIDAGLSGWLDAAAEPDVILLLIGTNDFSPPQTDPTNARFRLQTLLSHIVAQRPYALVCVADVPQRVDNASSDSSLQTNYNPYIPGIVDDLAASGAHVVFVPLRSQLTSADLCPDGLHPNSSGYAKIAAAWRTAIEANTAPEGTAIAPAVLRVSPQVDLRHVVVTFSKPVEDAATNLSHFALSGGVTVLQATLDSATKRTITLTTSLQATNTSYTLTMNGIRDRTAANLTIAGGTAVTFQSSAVAEAASYTLVYGLELPSFANYRAAAPAYSFDTHASVGAFTRVAYYVESQTGSAATPKYLWASMDAFTTDAAKLALPTAQSGAIFQAPVTSLNVRSNVAGITTGDGLTGGRLEFWPGDYSPTNSAGVSGASSTLFDFGDSPTPGGFAGYGSMQLHNRAASQTLFSFSGWGGAGSFADLGLGNQSGGQPDWTLSQSAIDYSSKRLQVYVLPSGSTPDPFISGQPSSRAVASGASVTFSVTASGSAPLSYQWRRNGSAISGATSNSYTVASAQTSNAGTYDVVVTSGGGPLTSEPAVLSILTPGALANGSFESDYAGWMATGNQLIAQRATDGANGVIFNGGNSTPNGTLLQTVATVPGQTYALSFDVGVNGATNTEQRLNLTVQGNALLVSQTSSVYTSSSSAPQWTPTTCTFVADSATTTITFTDESQSTNAVDLLLDNVRLAATAAVTPTMANGGFESDFSSWTFSGNLAVVNYAALPPPEGSKLLAFHLLGTTPNGTVSQTFPTTPGQLYELSFDLGVRGFNTNQQRLFVTIQGSGTLVSQLVTINAINNGIVKWVPTHFSFTANSSSTTVTFQDQSTTSTNISVMLDNVRVTAAAVRTLSVTSAPLSGLSIVVSPIDNGGAGSGATPFSRSYNTGTVVSLTAPATDTSGNAFLKWQRNSTDYSTSPSTNVTLNSNDTFTAVYVTSTAPTITAQPQNLTAPVGATATFSVAASGSGTLSYQWRRNGTNISGATQSSYTLNNVQATAAGSYNVLVSNAGGSATSATAVLTVISSGVIANGSFENDFDAWTTTGNLGIGGSGGSTDGTKAVSFNWNDTTPNGVLTQRFVTTPGLTYTLAFDAGVYAFNTKEQRLQVTASGASTLVSQSISIFGIGGGNTKWVAKSYTFTADSDVTVLSFQDTSASTSGLDLKLDNVRLTTQSVRTFTINSTPSSGVSITVTPADNGGLASGSTPFTRTYSDGTAVTLTAPTTAGGLGFVKWQRDGADYSTSAGISVTADANRTFTAVYSSAVPIITSQPAGLTATAGSSATFSVTASSTTALSYQWRRNGTNLSGATQSSYTIASAQAADAGSYDVVVSNSGGPVTSSAATLTVVASGVIANGSFESDFDAWTTTGNLGIGGSGGSTDGTKAVSFNWNDTTPNGVLVQRFTTTPGQGYVLTFDAGVYAFNTKEQRLQVTVQGGASLVSQVVSIFGTSGGTTKWVSKSYNFVADSSVTTLRFQDVSATTSGLDLKLDHVGIALAGAPVIAAQPADLSAEVSRTAVFSVNASGIGTLNYQWRRDGSPISGATQSTLALDNVQTTDAGSYDVVVSNSAGDAVTSDAATLAVVTGMSIGNGSFESALTNWSVAGNVTVGDGSTTDGAAAVSFNGGNTTPNGTLVQRFATVAGQTYTLAFDAGAYGYTTKEQRLQVTVQGASNLLSQTVSIFGLGGGATRWLAKSYTFAADSSTTSLTFRDVSPVTASLDLKLDHVRMTP